jgi:hypothetical protein
METLDILLVFFSGIIVGIALSLWAYLGKKDKQPIMAGQVWLIPTIGRVKILSALGKGAEYPDIGKELNVAYITEEMIVGYVNSDKLRNTGTALNFVEAKQEKFGPFTMDEFLPYLEDAYGSEEPAKEKKNNILQFKVFEDETGDED